MVIYIRNFSSEKNKEVRMPTNKYEVLKLENQLCFPLYAGSRELIKKYSRILEPLDLTYTQFIAMVVLWEKKSMTVKEMSAKLYLDSGTLTPLLKKLEAKGFVERARSKKDERNLIVTITKEGMSLRDKALPMPAKFATLSGLDEEESKELYRLLYKIMDSEE